MAYDAATGTALIGGGETWTWNGSTWTKQAPAVHPRKRFGTAVAYDAATRTVLLFGGAPHGGGFLSNTWTRG
jgi:hypothetical protein